jgi:hypothetical protein
VQARVREPQPRLVHGLVAVDEQIEVDRARSPALAFPNSSQLPLDPQQDLQQAAGRQLGLDRDGAVQERRLVDDADGRGLAELRHLEDLDFRLRCEQVDRSQDRDLLRAEVSSEADVRLRHGGPGSGFSPTSSLG